jgi:hypothetical protein
MCWDCFRWAKDVCLDPSKNAKATLQYGDMVKRLLVISLLPGAISTVAVSLVVFGIVPSAEVQGFASLGSFSYLLPFMMIPIFLLAAALGPFVVAAVVQLFSKLLFKLVTKEFRRTYNAVAYASVPTFLFSWVPVFGQLSMGWSAVIAMYSLASQQGVKNGRAIVALAVPVAIVAAIAMLLGAASILAVDQFADVSFNELPSV